MGKKWFGELEELLPMVSRPSRYLGGEVGSVRKDLARIPLRFALAFPDTYEIGMSHLGFKLMYGILNAREEVAAERFFVPWPDMEEQMDLRGIPLLSLESRVPLHEFHVIGFSIPYEMGYSNVLHMLRMGGIKLFSEQRAEPFPLVIAGGTCCVNPEPIAPFLDAFVLGDGEEAVQEVVDLLLQARGSGWSKERILEGLAGISGVYVPRFFHVEYSEDGSVSSLKTQAPGLKRVVRRVVLDLDSSPVKGDTIVPYTEVVHDRACVEIARGCTRGCRFCQAGFTYRPVRERGSRRVLELAQRAISASGYEELSLLSLSSGDHSSLIQIVSDLSARYVPERVALSFPSLRVGSLSDQVLTMVREVRKTGITIAPEAGTERLRRVINKDLSEEEVLDTVSRVFSKGWVSLKLYFMVGLPTETMDDLEGIVEMCRKILDVAGCFKKRARLAVSISTFVPKPHTPLQWTTQISLEETIRRLGWLRKALRRKDIQVKWQEPRLSQLEGAFSRGDRRLAQVLLMAHEMGCKLDGWSEYLRYDLWEEAFRRSGIQLEEYVGRKLPQDKPLPWDHLDVGVSQEFLLEEYNKAMRGEFTSDCRSGTCHKCGVCDARIRPVLAAEASGGMTFPGMGMFSGAYHRVKGRDVLKRFRVRYAKTGQARFLGHLEMGNVLLRALRRAGIALRFSEGHHPMPRVDLGPGLPLGVESWAEFMDLETLGFLKPEDLLQRLGSELPEGIKPISCEEVDLNSPSLFREKMRSCYRVQIPNGMGPRGEELRQRVEGFLSSEIWLVRRRGKDGSSIREVDIRPLVEGVCGLQEDLVSLRVLSFPEGGTRLVEILGGLLSLEESQVRRLRIWKTNVDLLGSKVQGRDSPIPGEEGGVEKHVLRACCQCDI